MKRFIRLCLWPRTTLRIVTFEDAARKGEQDRRDAVKYCRSQGFEAEVLCCPGKPGKQLLCEAADWQADMIVLGNQARSLLSRGFFGETAFQVIRQADHSLFLDQ